jgi:LacI family transcriptional regulator
VKKRPRKKPGRGNPGPATVKDIAREANVSVATVSLALEGKKTTRVSQGTRQRILEIARQLNYQPNLIARSLVTKKSYTLGLVITTLFNPFYAELSQDIIDRSEEMGYHVFTCSVRGGLQSEQGAVEGLISRGVDGLIICSALRQDPVIKNLMNHRIPFVLAMRKTEPAIGDPLVDFIGVDNRLGGYKAMEHLLALGHRRIGLITGPMATSTGHDRKVGAMSACQARGLNPDQITLLEGDFHRTSGRNLAKNMLSKKNRPSAIFAGNDHMAIGVLDALAETGLRCPEDVAVVGFDDIEMAGLPGVDLTTVSQKKSTMGRLAVDQLVEKIKGDEGSVAKTIILEPILVIRKTCGFHQKNQTKKA